MRTVVEKYRRPLLAVFGVLLMIVFMLPADFQPGGGQHNPVIGHVGDQEVHAAESAAADQDWELLTRVVIVPNPQPRDPNDRWLPLAARFLPADAFRAIAANRETYFLLQKEAELRGISVTQTEVDDVINDPRLPVVIADQRNGRVVQFSDIEDLDRADRIRAAIGRLLAVARGYEAAVQTIKVSQPLRRQFLAEQTQSVNLNLVSVPANQFPAATPTPEQLQEQFTKYANVSPDDVDKSPYGYGYRFPDRVKLQLIELPTGQIRAAAERARNRDDAARYEWDREAYKFYTANQSRFPTTNAAATTTTAPAATRPTTRPFAEARDDARRAVIDNDVARLTSRMLERITSAIASDYVAYRNAVATGAAATTMPATSVGPAYNTYQYLQTLAAQVQKEFDLLPPTRAFDNDFLTETDIDALPGLGSAFLENEPISRYIFTRAAALSNEKDDMRTLQPFEPSSVARDPSGNAYVFRLTDAQPAHAAASLQEVAAAVEADVRGFSQYQQARKVADDLAAKAKQAGSLQSAAAADPTLKDKLTTLTGVRQPSDLAAAGVGSPVGQRAFLRQIHNLVATTTESNPNPVGVIELPREGRAVVAQVTGVQSALPMPELLAMFEAQATLAATAELAAPILRNWFDFDKVAARIRYTPTPDHAPSTPATPTAPNNAPPRQPIL